MHNKLTDGGPAFPVTFEGGRNNGEAPYFAEGMSLRAYLAAHAPVTLRDAAVVGGYDDTESAMQDDATRAATFAVLVMMRVEYADALITELSKGSSK